MGQRPFETFPKIHSFWRAQFFLEACQASRKGFGDFWRSFKQPWSHLFSMSERKLPCLYYEHTVCCVSLPGANTFCKIRLKTKVNKIASDEASDRNSLDHLHYYLHHTWLQSLPHTFLKQKGWWFLLFSPKNLQTKS